MAETSTQRGMTMTAPVGRWRVTYAPGKSLILAGPTSLVLLTESDGAQQRLVNALWEQVIRSATMSELAARLAVFSLDKLPGFAALFWTPSGMRSLVRGDVTITDPSSGDVIANGSDITTWSESGLGNLTRVSVTTGEGHESGPILPLVVGVAYASWVSLDATPDARVTSPQASEDENEHAQPVTLAATSLNGADSSSSRPPAMSAGQDPWGPDDGGPDTEPMAAIEDGDDQWSAIEDGDDPWSDVAEAVDRPADSVGQPDSDQRPLESAQDDMLQGDTRLMGAPGERRPFDWSDPQLFSPQQAATAQAEMPPPVSPDVDTPPTLTSSTPVPSTPPPDGSSTESLILAADCPSGHSNPPAASNCRICGAAIPPQGPRLVRRPVLCVLQASDGTTADVDRAVLVGRAPDPDRSNFKAPRLMSLQSPGHDISRTHIEVAPEGWQVVATDLNSTNGTVLVRPGGFERQQLAPGDHVPVQPGSVLELGDGVSITVALPS
jgi:FHA domain